MQPMKKRSFICGLILRSLELKKTSRNCASYSRTLRAIPEGRLQSITMANLAKQILQTPTSDRLILRNLHVHAKENNAIQLEKGEIRPLRVAYLVLHFPHLTETFVAAEIHAIRAHGIDVRIISLLAPRSPNSPITFAAAAPIHMVRS